MSAIATIAAHVANTSDKVADLVFLELDEAGQCVQRALLALDAFSFLDAGPSQLPRFEHRLGT